MEHDKKFIEEIADEVQREYGMCGLSDGLYLDFATDVAIRYAHAVLPTAEVMKSGCVCIEPTWAKDLRTHKIFCLKCNKDKEQTVL